MTTELTAEQWKMRALEAETAVRHALFLERSGRLTAANPNDTLHGYLEFFRPSILIRDEHRPIEVYKWADACDCDPNADDYEDAHAESAGDADGMLCSRSFLGRVCEICEDVDERDGPDWKPDAVLWPCPPVAALNGAATAAEANEIARKLLASPPAV